MDNNCSKKKVLIIGVDTSTKDAINYLKSRNIYTIITDYNSPDEMIEKRMADEYWMIDVADTDAIEKACIENGITNIFAGNHEFCLDQCIELCKRLGFPFYASESGWRATRDKEFYKKKCIEFGLLVPHMYLLDESANKDNFEKIEYPIIIKPNDGNGRRGVFVVDNEKDLKHFYSESMKYSVQKKVLVEEYVQGEDIFIFGYIHHRQMYLLDVILNHEIIINGEKRFGFFDHNPSLRRNFDKKTWEAYQQMVGDLECENGICVFQGIKKEGLIYNMELGFRLDGFCTWRRTKKMMGTDYLELMVNLALGEDNTDCFDDKFKDTYEICLGYTIWGRPGKISKIVGRDQLYNRDDIIVLWDRFRVGDTIPDGSDMRSIAYAFEIFGASYEEISNKIQRINHTLYVYDDKLNNLLEYRLPEYENWDI